ncbi:MAG: ZIP family metal transporter [Tepidibacillus sp.]
MISMLIGSLLAGISTGIGALPLFFLKELNHRMRDTLLAFTAGVMVSASTFSLIPQAKEGGILPVFIGVFLGTNILLLMERVIPHIDIENFNQNLKGIDHKAWLIVVAITLHNIPEGLSVGVSYASEHSQLGPLIAIAIGLQNAPEGLLVGLFLVQQKISKGSSFLIALFTGMIEVVAAIAGYLAISIVDFIVPYGLAFAAGAMIYIVYKELIPESHGHGYEVSATIAFVNGLLVMFFLNEWFM